jgi:hypothetical protein
MILEVFLELKIKNLNMWAYAVPFPMGSLGLFNDFNYSGCTVAPGSTQSLTEISTRDISWG